MKKIIVPIDFSGYASYALDFAVEFNEYIKGAINLVHVVELPSSSLKVMGDAGGSGDAMEKFYVNQFLKKTEENLNDWAQRVLNAGQDAYIQMKEGNPYENISKIIAEIDADWIIMGTKGASGLKEVFIGSNAERMIRHADCPVITVSEPSTLKGIKSMVYASDLSKEQDWIVEKVKEIQLMLDINIHILKVRTRYNMITEREALADLQNFVERHDFMNYSTNSIEAELTHEGILSFAEEVGAGLIALGTHGKKGAAHFFGGSRAEDLANKAKIPVFTFKLPQ